MRAIEASQAGLKDKSILSIASGHFVSKAEKPGVIGIAPFQSASEEAFWMSSWRKELGKPVAAAGIVSFCIRLAPFIAPCDTSGIT